MIFFLESFEGFPKTYLPFLSLDIQLWLAGLEFIITVAFSVDWVKTVLDFSVDCVKTVLDCVKTVLESTQRVYFA